MPKSPKRQKASDVLRETNFLLASKGSFASAFPEIASFRAEVVEEGRGVRTAFGNPVYTQATAGEYINCSNPLCYNGGFALGQILRFMLASKTTELEDYKICQGYEGSPKGRRNYGPCGNAFCVKVVVEYRREGTSSSDDVSVPP